MPYLLTGNRPWIFSSAVISAGPSIHAKTPAQHQRFVRTLITTALSHSVPAASHLIRSRNQSSGPRVTVFID